MSKKIMKKCPKCGYWCEVAKRNALKRALDGFGKSAVNGARIGASIGGKILGKRGRKIGAFLGGAVSGGTGAAYAHAAIDAISGDEYIYRCTNCGYEWTADIEEIIESEDWSESLLEEFVEAVNGMDDSYEAIEYAEENISRFPPKSIELSIALGNIGMLYENVGKDESALQCFLDAINNCKDGSIMGDLCYRIYNCFIRMERLAEARQWSLMAALCASDSEKRDTTKYGMVSVREESQMDFDKLDDIYTSQFLEIPYKDRKCLLIVDGFNDLFQDYFKILSIDADLSQLSFPTGHPIVNEMYVAHPVETNRYLPIEKYKLELTEEKLREFCRLVQCLGAKEIKVRCLDNNIKESEKSGNASVHGGASYKGNKIGGGRKSKYDNQLKKELESSISFHQTFQPIDAPNLPDDMIWYHETKKWQDLYKQRLRGLLTHKERIETKAFQFAYDYEMKEIKAEVECLLADINVEFDETERNKFEQQENVEIEVEVKFAPLSELMGQSEKSMKKTVPVMKNTSVKKTVSAAKKTEPAKNVNPAKKAASAKKADPVKKAAPAKKASAKRTDSAKKVTSVN